MSKFIELKCDLMKFSAIVVLFVMLSCSRNASEVISHKSNLLEYSGRVNHENEGFSEMYWSGSSVKISFEGSGLAAVIDDENGENYYNIIIDGDSVRLLRLQSGKKSYVLVNNLPEGEHSVELFKRTEYTSGATKFYGFEMLDGTKAVGSISDKTKSIEFYGNSITCGYAVCDESGLDRPDSIYTDNYKAYSSITARHFNAKYTCISRSGIGVTCSWFPVLMPDIYNRLNPSDEKSLWDFSLCKPDVVVVNLLQNDKWLMGMPEHPIYKKYYNGINPTEEYVVDVYGGFIDLLRKEYADASIVCMLGSLDITKEGSVWPELFTECIEKRNDDKLYTLIVPYKNTKGHPDVEEQKYLADKLISFIDENIDW